jgi:hypothetical protein
VAYALTRSLAHLREEHRSVIDRHVPATKLRIYCVRLRVRVRRIAKYGTLRTDPRMRNVTYEGTRKDDGCVSSESGEASDRGQACFLYYGPSSFKTLTRLTEYPGTGVPGSFCGCLRLLATALAVVQRIPCDEPRVDPAKSRKTSPREIITRYIA